MSPVKHATPWTRLTEAALAYADADSTGDDADFMRKRDRLRKAAIAYAVDTSAAPRVVRRKVLRRPCVVYQLALWPRAMAS